MSRVGGGCPCGRYYVNGTWISLKVENPMYRKDLFFIIIGAIYLAWIRSDYIAQVYYWFQVIVKMKDCYSSPQTCWCIHNWGSNISDKRQINPTAVSLHRTIPSPAAHTEGKAEALPACSEAWKRDTVWVERCLFLRRVVRISWCLPHSWIKLRRPH
jgi:hypothetical protein